MMNGNLIHSNRDGKGGKAYLENEIQEKCLAFYVDFSEIVGDFLNNQDTEKDPK